MKKRIISLLLALAMVLPLVTMLEVPVVAATSGTTGDCTWTLDGTTLTISGNGATGDYYPSIPWGTEIVSVIVEEGVTALGEGNFYECSSLSKVTLPNSLTSIGAGCFSGCTNLVSITIPDSVTSFGNAAFSGCALTSFTLPKNLTRVEGSLFNSCASLISVTIPEGVETIGGHAFFNCPSLTSVILPKSVTCIEWSAFASTSLADVYYSGTNADREKIIFYDPSSPLTAATWHYNSCVTSVDYLHVYDNDKDSTCNECGFMRQTYMLGDANEDGKVNNKDLVMIQRFINSWGNEINEAAADYNEDGKVNNKDLVMIQRYINGWFDTPEMPEGGGESGENGPIELPEDNFKD